MAIGAGISRSVRRFASGWVVGRGSRSSTKKARWYRTDQEGREGRLRVSKWGFLYGVETRRKGLFFCSLRKNARGPFWPAKCSHPGEGKATKFGRRGVEPPECWVERIFRTSRDSLALGGRGICYVFCVL